jgi:hypothetical protein
MAIHHQLPPERTVDCGCDPRLHLPVLGAAAAHRVHACLRCGTATCTVARVWEPRPHDVRLVGHDVVALPATLLAWLGAWPRVSEHDPPGPVCLAAAARCESAEALPGLLDATARAARDAGWTRGQLLRAAGPPAAPPPVPLPEGLGVFGAAQELLALDADAADVRWLLALAARHRWDPAGVVAIDVVLRRRDAAARLRDALRGSDADARAGALAVLVEPPRALLPELLPALLDDLDATPLEPGSAGRGTLAAAPRATAALELLASREAAAAVPADARAHAAARLRALAARVGRHDWALVRRLQDAARALAPG